MMLMRDKSGRSGRCRGSQNPGTAMASAGGVTAGECGALCGGLTACALAAAGIAANKAATAIPRAVRLPMRFIRCHQ